ncbi:Retrovirus-related Pol poly from transposon opus [Labeo rohita]|uniref:Retrovirus-related Pol poly from transposon opus n=1 Tax=Labeo rohita TaxID=84645 RepID=A0A498NX54_LABRO|nr:Retrovirus-related Pol poly from transposon opus [Labeo rohita]RXN36545.1 Retrovirus-related Pol poly from transposon opus [Labeo rohita]
MKPVEFLKVLSWSSATPLKNTKSVRTSCRSHPKLQSLNSWAISSRKGHPSSVHWSTPVQNDDGAKITLPLHLLYQPGDMNFVTAYTTHQYLEELHQHLRMTFSFAQQQLQKSTEDQKAYYDQKASYQELRVRDKVWYYSFAQPRQNAPHLLSKKFLPHW